MCFSKLHVSSPSYLENHCSELVFLNLTTQRRHRKCPTILGRVWGPIWEVPHERLNTVHLSLVYRAQRYTCRCCDHVATLFGEMIAQVLLHKCVWICLDDEQKLNLKHYHKNFATPPPRMSMKVALIEKHCLKWFYHLLSHTLRKLKNPVWSLF